MLFDFSIINLPILIKNKHAHNLGDISLLQRPAKLPTNYGQKLFKSDGVEISNLHPTSYKLGLSLNAFKNMANLPM